MRDAAREILALTNTDDEPARAGVVDYLEMFYNSTRLHAYLGYVSPNAYEVSAKVA